MSGVLWGSSIPEVVGPVREAVAAGADRVVVDVSVLRRGDRAALFALAALRGRDREHPSSVVDVVGVSWAPFRQAVREASVADLDRLCAVLDELRRPLVLGWSPVGLGRRAPAPAPLAAAGE